MTDGGNGGAGRASLAGALLSVAPHVALETRAGGALYWVDARGLPARRIARAVLGIAHEGGHAGARVGMAGTTMAAELAATGEGVAGGAARGVGTGDATDRALTAVPPGTDASFLAPLPLTVLAGASGTGVLSGAGGGGMGTADVAAMIGSLHDVGLESCGDLARLTRAAVELRFGPGGVALWRLARADAAVRTRHSLALFPPRPRALPSASFAWDDYVIHDTGRLVFVVNRLVSTLCDALQEWGEGARAMALHVALADRAVLERPVRAARATASRRTWVRLVRAELDRLTLPEAVVGLSLRVEAVGDASALQGDLFDRGFQSGAAVAEALAGLVDDGQATIVGLGSPERAPRHPLPERRARWRPRDLAAVLREDGTRVMRADTVVATRLPGPTPPPVRGTTDAVTDATPGNTAALALQLLPAPRRVTVVTERRRSYQVPVRFTDPAPEAERGPWAGGREGWVPILTAAGPDSVSGGSETGSPYAREYFHCLTSDGVLVLLYRDALAPTPAGHVWYVHGWWD